MPSDIISFVLKPSFRTSWTAFSKTSASLSRSKEYLKALRYSLDLDKEADVLEKAVQDVLNDGLRTKDIMSEGMPSDIMSFVLKPSFRTSWTAFSKTSASLSRSKEYLKALRYSLDLDKEADVLEKAVQDVLNDGLRTKDIMSDGMKETSTSAMGDAIISKLQ